MIVRIESRLVKIDITGADEDEVNEFFGYDGHTVKKVEWADGPEIVVTFDNGSKIRWDKTKQDRFTDAAILVLDLLGFGRE